MFSYKKSFDMVENFDKQCPNDRIQSLYPIVNEEDTPLPRQWNPKDRFTYLGLSQNNLRVHYKGSGKNHKDAASVRTSNPIPASCGIYYFEVKVVSKGRDGYMGIGLSAVSVSLNRLPGWDKNSYGYHGDDGNSFCCSGTGQPYGPTFTTGDIIGCCVNFIDNSCFYTKNGIHLGVAFRDLPANLYPTVGLQTPGEVVEANFGHSPFVFNIKDYMKEWEMKTRLKIQHFLIPNSKGEWQMALQKIVITYLTHHGFYATAEAFANSTRQQLDEDKSSIQNRQKIQKLILNGQISEAIETTQQLYPGLLEQNSHLLFMLKCRQFIEMVNGTDVDVVDTKSVFHLNSVASGFSLISPQLSPNHDTCSSVTTSVTLRTAGYQQGSSSCHVIIAKTSHSSPNGSSTAKTTETTQQRRQQSVVSEATLNSTNSTMNGSGRQTPLRNDSDGDDDDDDDDDDDTHDNDVDDDKMDTDDVDDNKSILINDSNVTNGSFVNGGHYLNDQEQKQSIRDEGERISIGQQLYVENHATIETILKFGRDLHSLSEQMKKENGENEENNKALKDAFSLLAYIDPWNSPVGHQLNPVQREPVCTALNSAILELQGFPKQPPLELAIAHATQCLKLMSKAGIGSCAFANISETLL